MKNHKKMEARRRQKTADRAKRRKAYTPPKPMPRPQPDTSPIEALKNHWFVLHGLNYLASDYTTGAWSPVADIYADDLQFDQMPSLQDVFVKLADTHFDSQTKTWTPTGRLLAAWLMVAPETMRGIRMALLGHLAQQVTVEQAADELVKPHNPAVWAFFYDQIASRLAQPEGDDAVQSEGSQAVPAAEADAPAPTQSPEGESTTTEHGDTSPV